MFQICEIVGIAQEIKGNEISAKQSIEQVSYEIESLEQDRDSLESQRETLEDALKDAYNDTDEEGEPDRGRIAALQARIAQIEQQISCVENSISLKNLECCSYKQKLENAEDKKQRIIYEIEERARKTSNNIHVSGGIYGAYSGVCTTLQSSLQSNMDILSQAAGILGTNLDSYSGIGGRVGDSCQDGSTNLFMAGLKNAVVSDEEAVANYINVNQSNNTSDDSIPIIQRNRPIYDSDDLEHANLSGVVNKIRQKMGYSYKGTKDEFVEIANDNNSNNVKSDMKSELKGMVNDGLPINPPFPQKDSSEDNDDVMSGELNFSRERDRTRDRDGLERMVNVNGDIQSGINNVEKSPQNIMWSDIEYVDLANKIQIADGNSSSLEWCGEKGNSLRVPKDKSGELYQKLREFGIEGIPYVNGDVDFSKVSKYDIEFVDAEKLYVELARSIKISDLIKIGKNMSRTEFNGIIRKKWQSLAKQQIVDRIIADEQFAKDFSAITGVNTYVIKKISHLDSELRINGLTLHETTDCKKIQLVPTRIHDAFKHAGGTAEMLERLINADIHNKVSFERVSSSSYDISKVKGITLRVDNKNAYKIEVLKDRFIPQKDVKPLWETRQSIRLVQYTEDGSKARIFDHPEKLSHELPYKQGNNERGMKGTCGLANLSIWLKIAGSSFNEKDVVNCAATNLYKDGNFLCSDEGGTIVEWRQHLWGMFGIDANVYKRGTMTDDVLIDRIAAAVEAGRAVSVGVNAGQLWSRNNLENYDYSSGEDNAYGDGGSNHIVGIVSCVRDFDTGEITHLYINDTGRELERDACRKVPIEDFKKAFCVKRASVCMSQYAVW